MNSRLTKLLVPTAMLIPMLCYAKEWRGIVPLHSTRADADRLIGTKKLRCGGLSCLYDLGQETVFVLYADEPSCKNDDATTSWKVPRDTVIEINIHFKLERSLKDLGLVLTKFSKRNDEELAGFIYYNDWDEGIEIEGTATTAMGINYYQEAKDNSLRCPRN